MGATTRDTNAGPTVRAAILGVNAWIVLVAGPLAVEEGVAIFTRVAAGTGVLALLVAGLVAHRAHRRSLAGWLLSGAFPAAAITAVAWTLAAHEGRADDVVVLVVQIASLVAYGASAAVCVETPSVPAANAPFAGDPATAPASIASDAPLLRAMVIVLGCSGAFALSVLAPTLGTAEETKRSWGEAAREGETLVAIVGASAAVAMITALGAALTTDGRSGVSPRERTRLVVIPLLIAALAALTHLALAE